LFGLSSYLAEQRKKEVGIRKVLGASDSSIFGDLSKEFIKWVLISNMIAFPAAYAFMDSWLQDFAYRTDLRIELFILSGLLALVIALITVSYQSVKSAKANPIDSLRYE
ncbi:ABC transporter permease, partial [candidate division KSB1 bacterium]